MFLSRPRSSLVTIQAEKIDRSLFECFELVSFLDLLPSEVERPFFFLYRFRERKPRYSVDQDMIRQFGGRMKEESSQREVKAPVETEKDTDGQSEVDKTH